MEQLSALLEAIAKALDFDNLAGLKMILAYRKEPPRAGSVLWAIWASGVRRRTCVHYSRRAGGCRSAREGQGRIECVQACGRRGADRGVSRFTSTWTQRLSKQRRLDCSGRLDKPSWARRQKWFLDYLKAIIERDVRLVAEK